MRNALIILFLLMGSRLFGQTPSVYGKLDTLEIFAAMLSESHGPDGSKYYVNGEQVRKIIYDDKRKLFDNLLKCKPCYLITLDVDLKPILAAVSYVECMVGSWIEYYKNGHVKSIGQFKENPTGNWSNLKARGYCSVRVGEWKYFDMNGRLIKVEHYNDGVLVQ